MTQIKCKLDGTVILDTDDVATGENPDLVLMSKLLSHIFYNHRKELFKQFIKEDPDDLSDEVSQKHKKLKGG